MHSSLVARWAIFAAAAIVLSATGALGASSNSMRCKNTPCTYFNHGQASSGKCGSVKVKKSEYCECIVNAKKKIEQVQSSCPLGS
ncbi:MAG: hypothetical protein ACRD1E_07675 [Terriglobales bacterium]